MIEHLEEEDIQEALREILLESLPEGITLGYRDVPLFECRGCGRVAEWPAEIRDFDPNNPHNLCGGSPRCCP